MANTAGITRLRKLQLGKETTGGTKVAPTFIWRGEFTFTDDRAVVFPNEDIGKVNRTDRNYIPQKGGSIPLTATPATFEQLPYLLEAGIKAVSTGVADGGGGSGKIYTYGFESGSTVNASNTYSAEVGNDNETYFGQFCYCSAFTIEGKKGESWMMSGNLMTRDLDLNMLYRASQFSGGSSGSLISDSGSGLGQFTSGCQVILYAPSASSGSANNGQYTITSVATGGSSLVLGRAITSFASGSPMDIRQTFSQGLTEPTVEEILFNTSKLYIDDITGTIGTTQITGSFFAFKFDVPDTGVRGNQFGDGQLYYTSISHTGLGEGTALSISLLSDHNALLEYYNFVNKTARKIRVVGYGTALTTAGTAYTYKTGIIDAIGKWESFEKPTDDNGNQVVTGTLRLGVDPTASSMGQVIIVNSLTTLA